MSFEPRTKAYWTDGIDDPRSLLGRSKLNELILGFHLGKKTKVEMRHIVVWNFHLRRAHKDYAWTSLASERFMVADLRGAFDGRWGLARQHIRKAHNELVEWKFLALAHKGGGKGDGSRYWPNFDLLSQAAAGRYPHDISIAVPPEVVVRYGYLQPEMATGNYGVPSSEPGTTVFPVVGTTVFPVNPPTGNYGVPEDPTTQTGLKRPGLCSKEEVSAEGGPDATAPAASSGFERIWQAYGKHGNKVASREAFAAIADPDVDHIAERAAAWAASAKPGQKRMPFEKWLAAEKYDEADRSVAKPAAKPTAKPAANDNPPAENKDKEMKTTPFPPRRVSTRTGTIEAAAIVPQEGDMYLRVTLAGGYERAVCLESRDYGQQERGQRELGLLTDAARIVGDIEPVDQLVGASVVLHEFDDGAAEWKAAADGRRDLCAGPRVESYRSCT